MGRQNHPCKHGTRRTPISPCPKWPCASKQRYPSGACVPQTRSRKPTKPRKSLKVKAKAAPKIKTYKPPVRAASPYKPPVRAASPYKPAKAAPKIKAFKAPVKAASPAVDVGAMQLEAQRWSRLYNDEYAPPNWSLTSVGEPQWIERAKQCRVYCLNSDPAKDVLQVLREREPVNIDMHHLYAPPVITTGYQKIFTATGALPPNIAIYMPAKITLRPHMHNPALQAGDAYGTVHVINSVGFAFDDPQQVDFKYFGMKSENSFKKAEFQTCLTNAFKLVFACAEDLGLRTVVLCYLGGGAFAERFKPYKDAYAEYFINAVLEAVKGRDIQTLELMGSGGIEGLVGAPLKARLQQVGIAYRNLGYLQDILAKNKLFVNAWDPHSTVGNGNASDNSLDGFFGRLSDMGYMSLPRINPFIETNIRTV